MHWRNVNHGRGALAAAVALLTIGIAIAGCGSSGDAAEVSTATLTKAQFLKAAIPACKLGTNEITNYFGLWEKEHFKNGKPPPEAARDKALSEIALDARKKQLERLKEIGLPREGEALVKAIYVAWEEGIEKAEKDLSSMQASNKDYAFHKAEYWGIEYGLASCWWD